MITDYRDSAARLSRRLDNITTIAKLRHQIEQIQDGKEALKEAIAQLTDIQNKLAVKINTLIQEDIS